MKRSNGIPLAIGIVVILGFMAFQVPGIADASGGDPGPLAISLTPTQKGLTPTATPTETPESSRTPRATRTQRPTRTAFIFPTEPEADPGGEKDPDGEPATLPQTGFAPGRITRLAASGSRSSLYTSYQNRLRIEIPKIGVNTAIVGIPFERGQWDVSWLWDQVGYLEGSAFPTFSGNTVLSAHAYLPSGEASAFSNLNQLSWGDEIRILFEGYEYVYAVRHRSYVRPEDVSFLESKDKDWVTLITCYEYDQTLGDYRWRFGVQGVLVEIREKPDPGLFAISLTPTLKGLTPTHTPTGTLQPSPTPRSTRTPRIRRTIIPVFSATPDPQKGKQAEQDPDTLPQTGFAQGLKSILAPAVGEAARYHTYQGEIRLHIPKLGVNKPIVGIPFVQGEWDLSWLWDQVGYLEGSAYPTWQGNTVLSAHAYLPSGEASPFADLPQLYWGDKIAIQMGDLEYIYEVQSRAYVTPDDLSFLGSKEEDWLTLFTCYLYDEAQAAYRYRFGVQAVLVEIH